MDVSRETFKGSDESTQNLILFDSIKDVSDILAQRHTEHDEVHAKLDCGILKSGKVNRRISAGSGLFGGFLAALASRYFGL